MLQFRIGMIAALLASTVSPAVAATFDTTGPYPVVMEEVPSLTNHTVYRPADLRKVKRKLPVLAFGNGACANAGNAFQSYLAEIASHGFVVVANGPISADEIPAGRPRPPGTPRSPRPPSADGTPGTQGPPRGMMAPRSSVDQLYQTFDWAQSPGNPFAGSIDKKALAAAGQSCGGIQALTAASDPRVKTAVIFNSGGMAAPPKPGAPPATGMASMGAPHLSKSTPLIYIIGGPKDIAYPNANRDFGTIENSPLFKANLDVGHDGTLYQPHGGGFAEMATAWLKWQLQGDRNAAKQFTGANCGYCSAPGWTVERKNLK